MTWLDPTIGPQQRGRDDEYVRRAHEALSHSASLIHVRADAPVGGGANVAQNKGLAPWTRWFDTANKLDKIWSPTHDLWICLTPQSARVDTDQTRALTIFGDLTTVGPAKTLDTGTAAIVTMDCTAYCGTDDGAVLSVAVSGATTLAAADANGRTETLLAVNIQSTMSRRVLLTGLNAGSNTFTLKYRSVAGGTVHFYNRDITVEAIPT